MQEPSKPPSDPRRQYTQRLEARRASLAEKQSRHRTLGNLRLLVFFAAFAMAFAIFDRHAFSAWWLLAPLVAFQLLASALQRVSNQIAALSRAVAFYQRCIERLDGRWAGTGETGERFIDSQHLYAQDLDLFGSGSLFELLSSARTRIGEDTLAAWLQTPATPEVVEARQQAVEELSTRLSLREDLAVLGEDARSGVHPQALAAWGEREPILKPSPFRLVAVVLSLLGVGAAFALVVYVAAWMGAIELPESTLSALRFYFLFIFATYSAVLWRFKKRTEQIIHEVEEALHDLGLLAGVLQRLESETFSAPRLATLRAKLEVEGRPPSRRIARLKSIIDLLDSRHNGLFGVFTPLLLWDLQFCYALEDWRASSGPALRHWLNAVGEMEALSSLAGFHFEHPSYVFPEFVAESPSIDAEQIAHPLLPESAVVANDVRLGGELQVFVVSGSNMSGKSTLLRTIGVNIALAQAGAPTRAKRLRLSPLSLGASIRIQDSLQEGASRFYAEIKRLRQIMEKAGGEPPLLFLIDEFLHGTNSHDRRLGAEAIVRGLVNRGAIGFITTHDLALAHIADALAPSGANVHFEDHLENGKMHFDYKMRPGVVKKSNAIELMRSIGLEV